MFFFFFFSARHCFALFYVFLCQASNLYLFLLSFVFFFVSCQYLVLSILFCSCPCLLDQSPSYRFILVYSFTFIFSHLLLLWSFVSVSFVYFPVAFSLLLFCLSLLLFFIFEFCYVNAFTFNFFSPWWRGIFPFLKGTVARDFWHSGFFHESTPYSPRIHTLKYFWIIFRIRRNIHFWMLFRGVWYPAGLCSAGSDTPQDFVKRGIRPRRTSVCYKMYTNLPLFCGVWYPARLK